MNNFINENINIITAAGVIATIYGVYITKKGKKGKNTEEQNSSVQDATNLNLDINPNINPNISIINNIGNDSKELLNKPINVNNDVEINVDDSFIRDALLEQLRKKINILFIDDDKNFGVVNILKQSGWKNTKTVIDIKSLDTLQVKEAQIIFIDINGVGKLLSLENEGLDIAVMLKKKYPNKKIVIYSANRKHDNFHEAWNLCDYKLEKNALPFDFINLVENYSIELNETK